MRPFGNREFRTFLKAVDRQLSRPFRLDIIGEAAAVLSFRAESGTTDIDVENDVGPLKGVFEAAREKTGLDIPVGTVGIHDAPWSYEDRVRRVRIPGLRKLQVFVPEKHDWALMKIVRLLGKDIEDIREVSDKIGFNRNVFLKRFLEEMTHVIGRRADLVYNFVTMMSELYGDGEADRMEAAIRTYKG